MAKDLGSTNKVTGVSVQGECIFMKGSLDKVGEDVRGRVKGCLSESVNTMTLFGYTDVRCTLPAKMYAPVNSVIRIFVPIELNKVNQEEN